jgi:hypothetical protein
MTQNRINLKGWINHEKIDIMQYEELLYSVCITTCLPATVSLVCIKLQASCHFFDLSVYLYASEQFASTHKVLHLASGSGVWIRLLNVLHLASVVDTDYGSDFK